MVGKGDDMPKAIMIQGTASGVGKTILTLALCRIFMQDGHRTAPFKAQNMTLNTCLTENNEEIAVSQWLQAKAAGVVPGKDMNPIVISPPYRQRLTQAEKLSMITTAYGRICSTYEIIVIEGAGSPVELNLNHDDIVNMGMAKHAAAPVLLAADIDRGGVFASLYGTINLMRDWEKAHVKATVVNRFRGDPALFADGVRILEDITKLPVAGVVPFVNFDLPEEDSPDGDGIKFERLHNYEQEFDRIADTVRRHLNMGLVYEILHNGV